MGHYETMFDVTKNTFYQFLKVHTGMEFSMELKIFIQFQPHKIVQRLMGHPVEGNFHIKLKESNHKQRLRTFYLSILHKNLENVDDT